MRDSNTLKSFLIQDKSRHGLVKMDYSGYNCWFPFDIFSLKINSPPAGAFVARPPPPKQKTLSATQPQSAETMVSISFLFFNIIIMNMAV